MDTKVFSKRLPQVSLLYLRLSQYLGYLQVFPESRTSSASSSASVSPRFLHVFSTRPHFVLRTLLLALHSLAEGAAVGLADSSGDLWFLWVASAVHGSVALASFTLHLVKLEETPSLIVALSLIVLLFMVLGTSPLQILIEKRICDACSDLSLENYCF